MDHISPTRVLVIRLSMEEVCGVQFSPACRICCPLTMDRERDRGPGDDLRACTCIPCYTRPKYRFRAGCAVLPCLCCPTQKKISAVGQEAWVSGSFSRSGVYCCVMGTEETVGTSCSPGCMPFVWGCWPCNKHCPKMCCKSNGCCLCATWAQDSIDEYLARQLAR